MNVKNKRKYLCCLASFWFIATQAFAKTDFDWSASLTLSDQEFFNETSDQKIERSYQSLGVDGNLSLKINKYLSGQITPHYWNNFTTAHKQEQNFIDFPQTYIETKHNAWRLRTGTQIHNWGILDVYSPLDVVNQKAHFDPLEPKKLGALGLDLTWSTFSSKIQLLYLPKRKEAQYPSSDSRWLPREIIVNTPEQVGKVFLPEEINYSYLSPREFDRALENNFGVKTSFTFDDIDWNLVFFQGVNSQPLLDFSAVLSYKNLDPIEYNAQPDIGLIPNYYLQQTTGTNLVWANPFALVRFETAYTHRLSEVPGVNSWHWQNALGFEKQFFVGSQTITLLTHYYYANQSQSPDNLVGSSFRVFDNSGFLSTLWALTEQTSLQAGGIFDFNTKSQLFMVGAHIKIRENLRSNVKVLSLNGPPESLLGTFRSNDYGQIDLTIYF